MRSSEHRTVTSYERELTTHRCTEIWLREALAREEALLRQKDELIQQLEVLSAESDHRLLNGLQMIGSLLSLQSRASANAEAASQLAIAADRVATVGRVHRRLHSIDGVQTVAFKQYLEDLCRDFSMMLSSEDRPDRVIVVEGIEIKLLTATAVPLGFIANELITNAAKYGFSARWLQRPLRRVRLWLRSRWRRCPWHHLDHRCHSYDPWATVI